MAKQFDTPTNSELVNENRKLSSEWGFIFNYWHQTITSMRQSGTTAQRPTAGLWIGRRFYDTTLNKPIYFSALPDVWRDSQGTIV